MSFKSGMLVAVGSFLLGGSGVLAYFVGRYRGHKEVVEKVEDIREQVKNNPGMDLDDALEAQLTDEKGNFVPTIGQTNKDVDVSTAVGMLPIVAGIVLVAGAMDIQHEADKARYDRLEGDFAAFWDGTTTNYCKAYNKSVDVINVAKGIIKGLPDDSAERENLTSYAEGVLDFQGELDGTIGNFLRSKGAIRKRTADDIFSEED